APLLARILRNGAKGVSSLNWTVRGSLTVTCKPAGNGSDGPCFIFMRRSKLYLTACALTGVPSLNFCPSFSVNVQVSLSPEVVQVFASSPSTPVEPPALYLIGRW